MPTHSSPHSFVNAYTHTHIQKVQLLLQGLRGQALNDDNAAAEGTNMLVVEMDEGQGDDVLPLSYQPERLEAYFAKRPAAVRKRLLQIFGISSGFLFQLALDAATNKLVENDVKRAAQLREIITSLGPFRYVSVWTQSYLFLSSFVFLKTQRLTSRLFPPYFQKNNNSIKLGQALSIRPDILSPRAMVELQKLCDKVPSFDNKLAMDTIVKELGKPVDELFSELTPDPVGK